MDSSPQQGYDWVWAEFDELPLDQVVPVFAAVVNLSQLTDSLTDVTEDLDTAFFDGGGLLTDEWLDLHEPIKAITSYVCIPTALSSGQRTVAHKSAALLHALRMELTSKSALPEMLSSIRSFSSDMGTEISIPNFLLRDVAALLPGWLAADMFVDVDCGGSGDSGGEGLEPSMLCDVDAASRSPSLVADNDSGGDTDAEQQLAVERDLLPPHPPPPPEHLMNDCFTIPAVQHVVDNMTRDIHESLLHWPSFRKALKTWRAS